MIGHRFFLYIIISIFSIGCHSEMEQRKENKKPAENIPTIEKETKMKEENPDEFGFKAGEKPLKNPLSSSGQIMVTIVPDDTTIEGQMYRFEKKSDEWINVGKPIDINVGKNGLAWGKGGELSDNVKRGIFKKEGDGKAPAGIFTIGAAFGNATEKEMKAQGIKLPFLDVADNFYCVDDPESEHYNSIVSTDDVKKDWKSAEEMLRKDDLYDFGIFVNHNTPAKQGDGSCIIIHIWRAKGKPTHGCTAMHKDNILTLLKWIDPSQHPLLIQMTKNEYPQLKDWLDLPSLKKEVE